VELTNEAYENSQIYARMCLVYRGEVTYNENGTYSDHISRLTNSTDGIIDGVHALRDTYRADSSVYGWMIQIHVGSKRPTA
jgi:hypothetical protein